MSGSRPMQRRREIEALKYALAICIVFLAYEAVAYTNSYVLNLKGAGMDAEKFQYLASQWTLQPRYEFSISVGFYTQLIGTVFLIFGENEFIAAQTSVLALVLAARKLHLFLTSQGVSSSAWVVLATLLWPSLVPRGGTTLREPLILLATIYLIAEIVAYLDCPRASTGVKVALAVVAMFVVHKATGIMALGILVLAGLRTLFQSRVGVGGKVTFVALAAVLVAVSLAVVSRFSDLKDMQVLVTLLQGDVEGVSAVLEYKYGVDARAAYEAPINLSNPLLFVLTVFRSFLYYMLQPFPTRLSGVFDLYAFAEVLVRTALLVYILRHWRRLGPALRFSFLCYLLISLVWSVGTTNYGTASRHHLTNFWMLIALAAIARTRVPRGQTPLATRLVAPQSSPADFGP